jgi:hypothetical protein
MLKRLLFTLLCILFFMPVFAQTHEDSIKNTPLADTVTKHPAADSIDKKQIGTARPVTVESTAKSHPADSVVKQAAINRASASHRSAVKTSKKSPAKTAAKPDVVPDAEPKHSTVKTISDLRYNAFLKGVDLDDMSLAGDLNHYPSPDNVLKYKKQLDLSPIQVGQLTKLSNELHRKKIEMGGNIIRNEKMLDSLFHSRYIDEGSLIFYTNRSGLYYGEMKGAILMACYNTEKLLTPAQIKKLEALEKTN